jgi:hypothetical protein
MHTCYSLCTNNVLNLRLSNLDHPIRLLHSKDVFQLNKWVRNLAWTSGISIYTPRSKHNGWRPTQQVSGWPDAPVLLTGRAGQFNSCTVSKLVRTSRFFWPDSDQRPVIFLPLWMLYVNDLTLRAQRPVNYSSAFGRSCAAATHCCALTGLGCVRSTFFQLSVNRKPFHSLPIQHLCEWFWFRSILGQTLSYLVLSLTSVHHT